MATEIHPVAVDWMYDIIAAADVFVDSIREHPMPTVEAAEALDHYITTRNRHARPGSGHPARLQVLNGGGQP